MYTAEVRLIQRALTEGWPVPPERMGEFVADAIATVKQPGSERAKVACLELLVKMTEVNLKARKQAIEEEAAKSGAASDHADPERMTDAELRALVERGV